MRILGIEYRDPRDLKVSSSNVRTEVRSIDDLKKSIENVGVVYPVVINPRDEVVAGQRRLKASIEAGVDRIPVVVVEFKDEKEEILFSFLENEHQEGLDYRDRGRAVKRLRELGLTDDQISRLIGRPKHVLDGYLVSFSRPKSLDKPEEKGKQTTLRPEDKESTEEKTRRRKSKKGVSKKGSKKVSKKSEKVEEKKKEESIFDQLPPEKQKKIRGVARTQFFKDERKLIPLILFASKKTYKELGVIVEKYYESNTLDLDRLLDLAKVQTQVKQFVIPSRLYEDFKICCRRSKIDPNSKILQLIEDFIKACLSRV